MTTRETGAEKVFNDFFSAPLPGSEEEYDFEPSQTRQEFADDCDINIIMARYETTGVISHLNPAPPRYLDLTNVPDLATALLVMNDAEAAFMTLPAKVRREFDNDPVKFVEFAEKGENLAQMREWGLAPPAPVAPEPVSVRVIADPAVPEPPPGGVPKGA
ncbi:MAG: internal scaffolding protein [Microviridae sp.]|nr:MAG: internal scaffolding protein [Microviridae sp.]